MVNQKKVLVFESKLQEIRNGLLGDVEENLKSNKSGDNQNIPDIADEAARDYNNELMLSLGEQDLGKLKLVDEALAKIKSGEYGLCQQCKDLIPEARLKVIPFAKYCVKCLESIEKGAIIEHQHPNF